MRALALVTRCKTEDYERWIMDNKFYKSLLQYLYNGPAFLYLTPLWRFAAWQPKWKKEALWKTFIMNWCQSFPTCSRADVEPVRGIQKRTACDAWHAQKSESLRLYWPRKLAIVTQIYPGSFWHNYQSVCWHNYRPLVWRSMLQTFLCKSAWPTEELAIKQLFPGVF